MGQKYSCKALHPIRHMEDYIVEIMLGVSSKRKEILKQRFKGVQALAYQMYRDAYTLIIKLDDEMMQCPEFLWKHDLETVKIFAWDSKFSFGSYSVENLHPIRHFESYVEEINSQELTNARIEELKSRLAIVLRLAVRLYYDAERLLRVLD